MNKVFCFVLLLAIGIANCCFAQTEPSTSRKLWEAAQKGAIEDVKSALAAGVDVNAKTEYGATALFYACDRGNAELVQVLLDAGADPNTKDTFYQATPLTWAQQGGHQEIVGLLLKGGAKGANAFLLSAVNGEQVDFAKLVVESGSVKPIFLYLAREIAIKKDNAELLAIFEGLEIEEPKEIELSPEQMLVYVGKFASARFRVEVIVEDDSVKLGMNGASAAELKPIGPHEFLMGQSPVTFNLEEGKVTKLAINFAGNELELTPDKATSEPGPAPEPSSESEEAEETKPEFAASSEESLAADRNISSANWPSFRGQGARGVAEGQNPPMKWNVAEKENLVWQTPIPGLGLSCPSIWGDQIFVTSAVNEEADTNLKIGLYGSVDSVEEDFVYKFKVFCVDKQDGSVIWEQTAIETKPAVKRHAKSSHANPTVATDGKHVVAFFGSEGMYCYSMQGDLIWEKDFGLLDSGWFYDAGYQWGFGSSPIIFEGHVFVQCDIQNGSFVAVMNVETGEEVWRMERDEIPTWSSPTVHKFGDLPMLITHGTKAARGYDARNGDLLWTLPKHSEIVVPTPFVAHDMIFVASGYSPIQPIYAIRPSARGEIALPENESTSQYVAWSYQRGGPYMPSPIVYGDYMYCCSNSGILTCYDAKSGAEVYKERLKADGEGRLSFTASPVAGDGKLYLPSEDGRVLVIKAGPAFELLETNPVGENLLASPAISEGKMIFRTQNSVIAVGK